MPDLVAFEKAIEEYGDEILKKAKKMMKFSKRRFIRNAQKMAPTKTGALKKSIKTGTIFVDIENLTYRSIPIWYAVYVEFVPPRIPFMWPAYMKEREYVKRTQKRNLKKITRDVARKVARAGVPKESAA